mgnify:CR=1 FL=1
MTTTLSARATVCRANQFHPVLPGGIERDPFIRMVQRVAQHDGISRAAMTTFAQLTSMTLPSDWTGPDREPCVYANASEIAKMLSLSESRLRAHCAALSRVGLIDRLTGANGSRSREAGTGIFFRRLIAQATTIIERCRQIDADRKAAMHLRGQRSTHRRCVTEALEHLHRIAAHHIEVLRIEQAFKQWPAAEDLHRLDIDALQQHVAEADNLCRTALRTLENLTKTSGGPLEIVRSHIQEESQEESVLAETVKKPATVQKNADDGEAEKRQSLLHSEFLVKLTPERLFQLASPDMQLYLSGRAAPEQLRFHDFIWTAERRLPELGIDRGAWDDACDEMGPERAMMAVLILDARRAQPDTPIISPIAYFNGMRRAHRQDRLNLIQSLIGLSERHKMEDDRPCGMS